jgi:hypothetical protein
VEGDVGGEFNRGEFWWFRHSSATGSLTPHPGPLPVEGRGRTFGAFRCI